MCSEFGKDRQSYFFNDKTIDIQCYCWHHQVCESLVCIVRTEWEFLYLLVTLSINGMEELSFMFIDIMGNFTFSTNCGVLVIFFGENCEHFERFYGFLTFLEYANVKYSIDHKNEAAAKLQKH